MSDYSNNNGSQSKLLCSLIGSICSCILFVHITPRQTTHYFDWSEFKITTTLARAHVQGGHLIRANMVASTLALLLAFCTAYAFSAGDDETIYVHIVPHTHDDVGWLKTEDGGRVLLWSLV